MQRALPRLRAIRSNRHERAALQFLAWIGGLVALFLLMRLLASGLPTAAKATGFFGPVFAYLSSQPFILLFVCVAAGYALGRVTIRRFSLGATAATLIIGLGLSLWASLRGVTFAVPDFASTLFFNLFMFSVGMKVGPQFLAGFRRDARAFIAIGLFVPLFSAALMFAVRALFHLAPGLTSGIFAGANTATPGLGAAKDVFSAHGGGDKAAIGNLSTAFAFGYCLSLVLFVLMMKVLPRWFGRDARKEAQALQKEIESGTAHPLPGTATALVPELGPLDVRVFRLENPAGAGVSVAELAVRHPQVAVEQVQRSGQRLTPTPELKFEVGDLIVLSGPLEAMVRARDLVGAELPEARLRDIGMETVEAVAQQPRSVGKKVGELMGTLGQGFYLNAIFRGGTEIPFGPDTVVQKGDVLRFTGSSGRLKQLEATLGAKAIHPSMATDIVTLAIGLAVGAFLGTVPIPIPGLKLSLGSAVGLLITGIVLSTLRTRNPGLGGPFPEPARQLLEDLGLNVFIAITALNAGSGVIKAIGAGALSPIVICTLIVGFIPPVAGWALGQYRHHMNAGLLSGAISGARCSSPGLRTAQEDTQSSVPALSYPVTFAISNVVVTLLCYVMATMD